ncbi:hypothetical protein GLP30_03735 [Photobacterium phosphoreum]|uniref:Tyr recombinase domain-containing protein n=1 Tax=Photobacterium phosphoreum TaxID=659 RepID=A0AAW4ZL36_PHOPO|nr:hypothetical protein [Photobacterium phosphoreum]MCD9489939.1 hypothetical protein [Photobacterium phosphoreum]MCF2189205.1 hypothetical protein [Photobacterium phosphoreum]MCF2301080.1 hypothetical protein [Photobacterium phosphoreum]
MINNNSTNNILNRETIEFISSNGLTFNALDDSWLLNDVGRNGIRLNLHFLKEKNFDNETIIDIKLTIAKAATTLSISTIKNMTYCLKNESYKSLSIKDIKLSLPNINNHNIKALQILFKHLTYHNKLKYVDTYNYLMTVKVNNNKNYDSKKHSYSDVEKYSIITKLNNKIRQSIEKQIIESKDNMNYLMKKKLKHLGLLIAIRLMMGLVRRPSQLSCLKWIDIIPVGSNFNDIEIKNIYNYSDINELQVRMFKGKQGDLKFRKNVEKYPLIINHDISEELLFYRCSYKKSLKIYFKKNFGQIEDDTFESIFSLCPIFFCDTLFEIETKNIEEFILMITEKSQSFHYPIEYFSRIINQKSKIMNIPILNNRWRHTINTAAILKGLPINEVAKITQITEKAVKSYIDLNHNERNMIDEKFIANDFINHIFSKNIIDILDKSKNIIINEDSIILGQNDCNHTCSNCKSSRPIGCYGCDNFHALITANHDAVLQEANRKYDIRKSLGEPISNLSRLSTQIKLIEKTIESCQLKLNKDKDYD